MTPERFWLAIALFHAAALAGLVAFDARWRACESCARSPRSWIRALVRDVFVLAVFIYAMSLLATLIANRTWPGRIHLGPISLRLLGQALFVEGPLLGFLLASRHRIVGQSFRAGLLATLALFLAAVHVDAYYIEPAMVVPRHYVVEARDGRPTGSTIRILHLTDIQTPSIGAREEEALLLGLSYRPDLIVMTGDYVQDALGEPTEQQAASDLRALMARIGFDAPLGVFATEGDVGPSCHAVFTGTLVRCLPD